MATTEILLAGFGGQGILFAGKILAYCGLMDGKELSWLPSYGPEMRGGTCNCSVCVSDQPIGSPLVLTPDILIAMNQPSFDKFVKDVRPGGKVFFDSGLIEATTDRTDIELFGIPSQQMADDNALKGGSNIILLGKVIKETGIFSLDIMKKGIEKVVPPSKAALIPNNFKAIELGMNA
ncbi:MAG: 2-oxoacid:acceptor oxidoreductase family protein [Ruminococcus sp.]|nr:2-oxoacid:acceptor oxidoreductase family protein [Ruminococcus sp.]